MTTCPIRPYGATLVDLLVRPESLSEERQQATALPSVRLTDRAVADLELMATGAYTPLDRFMGRSDYVRVAREMRLADGTLFPVPVTLSLPDDSSVRCGQSVALRDARNHLLASLQVTEIFDEDGLKMTGPLRVLDLPRRFDFRDLRLTPAQTRARLDAAGAQKVVAFQKSAPLTPSDEAAIAKVTHELDAALLLDPIVGTAQDGVQHFKRIRRYKALAADFADHHRSLLITVPLGCQRSSLRESLLHAIVRRNFGASHEMVSDDELIPQDLLDEIGMTQIRLPEDNTAWIEESPDQRRDAGFCIWFTGLSGAGKSTTADIVSVLLQERGRTVTLLDGDVVRTHLSKGLGFSREDRDANIRRIGFVAAEIVKHGGAAICAAVSPYRTTRDEVRALVGKEHFIEVFVDTPLEECERRDVKGMYAMARRGQIRGFTGIDDPYESPLNPELTLTTITHSPEHNADLVLTFLVNAGWVPES